MQSSAAVAGRALIMLACVMGIPALALSGTSWSEMLKKLQDFRWPAILDPASASTSDAGGVAAAGRGPATLAQATPPGPARSEPVAALPGQTAAPVPSAVVPAGYQELAAIPLPVVGDAGENAVSAAPATSDPFGSIQDRLRRLGATYYLLESWGNQQQQYRFYCKMAVGGSANYTRSFEATHADPLQAMRDVLRQVEAWRDKSSNEELGTRN